MDTINDSPTHEEIGKYPSGDDLYENPEKHAEAIEYFKTIKEPKDLISVKMEIQWKDDHELCLGVLINGKFRMSFWWRVIQFVALLTNVNNGDEDAKLEFMNDAFGGLNVTS